MLNVVLLLVCLCTITVLSVSIDDEIDARLDELLNDQQYKSSQQYWPLKSYPPVTWSQQKGLFSSFVHLNFHGIPALSNLRNVLKFPDNNGFVTMFVLQSIIEAAEINPDIDIQDDDLVDAMNAIQTHMDKNFPKGSPIVSFWNQQLNKKGNHYDAFPENIATPLSQGFSGTQMLINLAHSLGIDYLDPVISKLGGLFSRFLRELNIPSDFDDSGCNLALGMKLYNLRDQYPETFRIWSENNNQFEILFEELNKHYYDPFSLNRDHSTIDPRTYFWIRKFSDEKAQNNETLRVIPTWILSQSQIDREFYSRGLTMPFQCNNVDASVAANMMFGLTSGLLYNEKFENYFQDEDLQKLYEDTADMLVWVLESDAMNERPDLTLLYYPPVYDFYWFVSRISHLLNSSPNGRKYPLHRILDPIRVKLTNAIRQFGAEQLLNRMQRQGSYVFWDDFLGNADVNEAGAPIPKYEDRVFSTCVALNALIDMWTTSSFDGNTRSISWDKSTPRSVKQVINSGISWILDQSHNFAKENVFFSGSVKSELSLPFYFPQNVFREINSTIDLGCKAGVGFDNGSTIIVGVEGNINPNAYISKLADQCHGSSVPISNAGLNCAMCIFPYWSSPALTNTVEILVLSKAKNLKQGPSSSE